MEGVIPVKDGEFVGVVAPTRLPPGKRIEAIAKTAKWADEACRRRASFTTIFARCPAACRPIRLRRSCESGEVASRERTRLLTCSTRRWSRARRVAEWDDGKLTVWTATQNPFGVRGELDEAFRLDEKTVRVIVPDFGSGYGGKHTGECAVEAARLAQAAKKPVMLRWTREEEFTWAYFRPAAVIDVEASLDDRGKLATWYHAEYQRGRQFDRVAVRCAAQAFGLAWRIAVRPLRHGSYRASRRPATHLRGNVSWTSWRRAAGADPLEFRLAHLTDSRLRAVLEEAARRFKWTERAKQKQPNRGVGLACGTEKGSFVACCAEVEVDRDKG